MEKDKTFNEKFKVEALLMFVDNGIKMYSSANLSLVCRCALRFVSSAAAGKAAGKTAGVAAEDRVASLCSRILPEAEQLHQQIRKSGEEMDQCHIDLWLEQSNGSFTYNGLVHLG